MKLTEAQRRAVLADLRHPILGAGLDHEIADDHGVTPADVRRLRDEMRRDLGVHELLGLAQELAALEGWSLSPGELIELVMRERVQCARRAKDGGFRRSADGAVSRSRAPAEASEGISGGKGPEMTAAARSREVRNRQPRLRSPERASASRPEMAG